MDTVTIAALGDELEKISGFGQGLRASYGRLTGHIANEVATSRGLPTLGTYATGVAKHIGESISPSLPKNKIFSKGVLPGVGSIADYLSSPS